MLEKQARRFYKKLTCSGWAIPSDQCVWATTVPDGLSANIVIDGIQIQRRSREEGFMNNNFDREINNRMAKAWAAYSVHRAMITYRAGSLTERLKFLDVAVAPALFWGAGAWNLTSHQEAKITTMQRKMVRSRITIKKRPDESMAEYMARCNRKVSEVFRKFKVEHWTWRWRRLQ